MRYRHRSRILPAIRCVLVGLAACALVAGAFCDSADARSRRHHRSERSGSSGYQPPYAAIVVDANSGRVLHASNADSLRHPASITKIMTLYLLFEQLEAGKLKLDTRLPVSAHAAAQEPSKLGLEPGQTIATEDAIKAVVTKSANDIAVAIAETIGGSEENFASLMTRKAHALGMTRTVYKNASGLPDDEQVTTARDQALLGRAIQDRFPRYYRYFATSSFHFHGMDIRNHNHLLGRIQGVDGIKTGYTRASGFNLVTSVRRGGRHVVAVVFGGSSSSVRDARMRDLIEEHIAESSTQRTVAMLAETTEPEPARAKTRVAAADAAQRVSAEPAAKPRPDANPSAAVAQPRTGSAEPIQPIPVKTITVRPRLIQSAALGSLVAPAPQANVAPQWAAGAAAPAAAAAPPPPPAAEAVAVVPVPAPRVAAAPPSEPAPLPPPPGARPGVLGTLPVQAVAAQSEPAPASAPAALQAAPAPRAAASHSGWIIQIGAFADEAEAKQRLRSAQSMAHDLLAKADGFTERVVKGSKELYRARFAGFDKEKAEAACHYFKRNDIACMTLRN
jgi:D-alanyl-D-alanine carboxypeptidase